VGARPSAATRGDEGRLDAGDRFHRQPVAPEQFATGGDRLSLAVWQLGTSMDAAAQRDDRLVELAGPGQQVLLLHGHA